MYRCVIHSGRRFALSGASCFADSLNRPSPQALIWACPALFVIIFLIGILIYERGCLFLDWKSRDCAAPCTPIDHPNISRLKKPNVQATPIIKPKSPIKSELIYCSLSLLSFSSFMILFFISSSIVLFISCYDLLHHSLISKHLFPYIVFRPHPGPVDVTQCTAIASPTALFFQGRE